MLISDFNLNSYSLFKFFLKPFTRKDFFLIVFISYILRKDDKRKNKERNNISHE